MDDVLWTPGEDLALVWPGGVVMLPAEVSDDAATAIWRVARTGADLGVLLQQLTDALGVSLLSMPMFAIVLISEGRAQVAVRGDWVVEVEAADGRHVVRGSGITTWSEQSIDTAHGVTLGRRLPVEGTTLPVVSGVVRASAVSTFPRPSLDGVTPGEPVPDAEPIEDDSPARDDLLAEHDGPSVAVPAPADDSAADDVSPVEEPAGPSTWIGESSGDPSDDDAASAEDASAVEELAVPDEAAASQEAAAPREDPTPEMEPTPEADPTASWEADPTARWNAVVDPDAEEPGSAGAETSVASEHSVVTAAADGEPELISAVPGRERPRGMEQAGPVAAAAPDPDFADHDGATVVDFKLPEGVHLPPPSGEATVLALVCPVGHPNRPHVRDCRVCSAPLVGGVPQEVSRPALGRVRSSTGEEIPLTGPILVGRSPRASRFTGTTVPRLLALPFPHVSSSHAEIRLEGWSVFAVDLNSRNGTYLRRRDEPPVRVTEPPLMLQHGDILDFGHGVRLTFEDLP